MMSDQSGVREFWIREPKEPRKGSCIVATEVKSPWEAQAPQASSHWLKKPAFKVIEKSAFDSVVKDLAEQIKVNLVGQERELKLMHEVEKLRAENGRLKRALIKISEGCPTKYKDCKCLENTALIALAGHDEQAPQRCR